MKYCTYCGNELLDEAIICPKCGCPTEIYQSSKENQNITSSQNSQNVINIFYILGCILTGIITYFIGFAWTIPMTIIYFKKVKNNEQISIAFKVCSLIFVSQIAGIIMLCEKNK